MGGGDEVLDVGLVAGEVGVDVGLVDEAGALGLGEDEVEEEAEAEVGVEGDPGGVSPSSLAADGRGSGRGLTRIGTTQSTTRRGARRRRRPST